MIAGVTLIQDLSLEQDSHVRLPAAPTTRTKVNELQELLATSHMYRQTNSTTPILLQQQMFASPNHTQQQLSAANTVSNTTLPPVSTPHLPPPVPPSLIPKLRHLIWKNKTLPTEKAENVFGVWKAEEPNFEHILHDDDGCLKMVKMFTTIRAQEHLEGSEIRFLTPDLQRLAQRQYHYNFTQVYMDYQLHVMRADVCRVLSVYIHGGIYTDLDVHHSRAIASWSLRWDTHDIVVAPENPVHTNNFIFGASPQHPCMRVVLEAILREGQDPFPFRRSKHAVHHSTGPAIFTVALNSCVVSSSYFALPRTLYGQKAEPILSRVPLRVDVKLAPYTPINNDTNNSNTIMFAVKMALSREELWKFIRHDIASVHWKHTAGYKSWTARKQVMEQQLKDGKPVDAIGGRQLWPVIRVRDEDEFFPTLIPKKRHVVAQTAEALNKLQHSIATWEALEPHFTTVIHTSEQCHTMAQKYKIKVDVKEEDMPDVVCGLLAVHYEGGIYMDHSVCPKIPMTNWSHIVPWSTLDLFFTVDSNQTIGTNIIGAVAGNVCVNSALQSLNMDVDVASSKNLVERLSQLLSSCKLPHEAYIPTQWTVHYTRGFSKYQCMRTWVEEEGGRGLVQNFVNGTSGSIYARPTLADHRLFELVTFTESNGRC